MTRIKTQEIQELNAYFIPDGFVIEDVPQQPENSLQEWVAQFEADKYAALFHLGFLEKAKWFSASVEYLYHIAELLIKKLSQQAELEFNRDAVQVDLQEDELYRLKEELPFVIGMEYVNDDWIRKLWEALLAVFRAEIKNYDGTVARYFAEHNSNINVVREGTAGNRV